MKRKIMSIIVIFVLMLGISGLRANATTNACKIKLVPKSTTVEPGETIDINIKMSDITATDGLAAYSAKVTFDTEAFTYSKISGSGEWETPIYNEGNIVATVTSGNGQKENQTIGVLTLKVKSDAKEGKYKVAISDIEVSDGINTFEVSAVEKEITVKSETKSDNGNEDNNTILKDDNTIGDDSEDKNTTSKNNTTVSTNNNKTTSDKPIPYTGIAGIIVPTIIILAIVGIVSYYKYRNSI